MWNDKDDSGGPNNRFNGYSEVAEFQNPLYGSFVDINNRDGGAGGGFQRSEADNKRPRLPDFIPKVPFLSLFTYIYLCVCDCIRMGCSWILACGV